MSDRKTARSLGPTTFEFELAEPDLKLTCVLFSKLKTDQVSRIFPAGSILSFTLAVIAVKLVELVGRRPQKSVQTTRHDFMTEEF